MADTKAPEGGSSAAPPPPPPPELVLNTRLLYVSYFLAAWGDRMWEFAAVIFLTALFPSSLLLASVFGLFENIAGITCGGAIGRFIDSRDRLVTVRTSIVLQNVAICAASLVLIRALSDRGDVTSGRFDPTAHPEYVPAIAFVIAMGMIAKVASSLNKISIHKDWCVVLADGSRSVQTQLNANMRRVDLSCAILAPAAVGAISSGVSNIAACGFIAGWSFLSFFAELTVSRMVYAATPALQVPKRPVAVAAGGGGAATATAAHGAKESMIQQMRAYIAHPVFPISYAYCLLYVSVLSFGGIMVAFLSALGFPNVLLAIGRGVGALVAIGATVASPTMVAKYGLVRAGQISIQLQFAALTPLAIMFLSTLVSGVSMEDNRTVVFAIVFVCICSSRFGLWAFDLAQTQLMQELVAPSVAGRINGAQEIVINLSYMTSFTLTILQDDPRYFAQPALFSYAFVGFAAFLFSTKARAAVAEAEEWNRIVATSGTAEADSTVVELADQK